jgi:hypothetical protein
MPVFAGFAGGGNLDDLLFFDGLPANPARESLATEET